MHTKAIVDMCLEDGQVLEVVPSRAGANDLAWGRKGSSGPPWVGDNLYRLTMK